MLLLQEVQVQSLVGELEIPYGEGHSKKKEKKEEVESAWNEEKPSQHRNSTKSSHGVTLGSLPPRTPVATHEATERKSILGWRGD